MNRRDFLTRAALFVGAMGTARMAGLGGPLGQLKRHNNELNLLTYLEQQITPAAAAAMAQERAAHHTESLSPRTIFWSVMWPYMYTVGRAEGTVGNSYGINPNQVIYTFDRFRSYQDHPRKAHPILDRYGRPTGKVSDAAGWPQFLSTTWDLTVANNDFWYPGDAFSPANQDLGFLYLHRDTGGHAALMAGMNLDAYEHLTVSFQAFSNAIAADSAQWASLPGKNIGASTGQHTRPLWWLWTQFQKALWTQMGYGREIVHPVGKDKALTARMGYQAWCGKTHWGQDFSCPVGTAIAAPESGTLTLSGYEPKGGYYLSFRPHAQPELDLIFRHCQDKSSVAVGQPIRPGDTIGQTGNSGQSTTGAHAHIEVTVDGHHIDPEVYLRMAA